MSWLAVKALRAAGRRLSLGPGQQLVERRAEGLAPIREVVLDPRRNLGMHGAYNKAVALESPELMSQHLLRHGGNRTLEAEKRSAKATRSPGSRSPRDVRLGLAGYRALVTAGTKGVRAAVVEVLRQCRQQCAGSLW